MKLILLVAMLATSVAQAARPTPATPGDPRPSKKLDFEDGVVEGLNKRPLDSFQQISEADKKARIPHLYGKRTGFPQETLDTLKTVRYAQ